MLLNVYIYKLHSRRLRAFVYHLSLIRYHHEVMVKLSQEIKERTAKMDEFNRQQQYLTPRIRQDTLLLDTEQLSTALECFEDACRHKIALIFSQLLAVSTHLFNFVTACHDLHRANLTAAQIYIKK